VIDRRGDGRLHRLHAAGAVVIGLFLITPARGWAQPYVQARPSAPFMGSVPSAEPRGETLPLSLRDALDRALRYNLGLRESEQDVRTAGAVRLRGLDPLVPEVSGEVALTRRRVNLEASGFGLTIPGVTVPTVVGPFSVADARIYVTQQIVNWSSLQSWKSTVAAEQAARYTHTSNRETVIVVAGNAYLTVIADQALVESTRAQLRTAETLHAQAVDRNRSGVVASIDVLRAQVEQQTEQQRLIAAQTQLAIDMLALARIIGLPKGQAFTTTDTLPYAPLAGITIDEALQQATATRPDYLAAKASVRAAELRRAAAVAGHYPSLSASADYGDIGSPGFPAARGTFSAGVTLSVPIFPGTRVTADTLEADAELQQRQAELADLDAAIDKEVRVALLNIQSSSQLVAVSLSNIDLANQTLAQAQDRAAAGVASSLDVVQAQESVATANQSYIASVYAHNLAKMSLAQAVGIAEASALRYLGAQ
jgi:outer membrane protein TolC